jgi:hypothetical protein
MCYNKLESIVMEVQEQGKLIQPPQKETLPGVNQESENGEEDLHQEIAMYRSLIRGLADWIGEIQTLEQHERMVSLMGMAVVRLANLLRTQKILEKDRSSKWERDLQRAIQEITQDWNL